MNEKPLWASTFPDIDKIWALFIFQWESAAL